MWEERNRSELLNINNKKDSERREERGGETCPLCSNSAYFLRSRFLAAKPPIENYIPFIT
jgi:hypothetical protein